MNRLSWDTTAPRRPNAKRPPAGPRIDSVLEAEAELIRVAWDKPHRIGPF
jgi:hypothetical protein